jgi:DNA-binding transcriptional ArsR family regulator
MHPPTDTESTLAVFQNAAELFAALSCPKRLHIVCALRRSDQTVRSLAQLVNCSQPNVSGHLRRLRQLGIVHRERNGNAVVYRLTSLVAESVCSTMCAH